MLRKGEIKARIDDALIAAWNVRQRLAYRTAPAGLKRILRANAGLKDAYRGHRCFILGNGPSLAQQDLTTLAGEHTFVVNQFIRHPQAERIDPTFYVMIDAKVESGVWGTGFLEQIGQRLPRVQLFATAAAKRYFDHQHVLTGHTVHTIHPELNFHFGFDGAWEPTGPMPCATNVTKAAFFVAAYLGFNPIYLLGIDGNGLIAQGNTHFYGRDAVASRCDATTQHQADQSAVSTQAQFESDLMAMAMGLRGWRAIADWSRRQGIDVFYANPAGIIEAFPRVSLEEVVRLRQGSHLRPGSGGHVGRATVELPRCG
jgi:hypothetical protein